ncbi:MAG TPA: proton-conducting transporter membrane subunit [Solirubrobacteraceae bacterium]
MISTVFPALPVAVPFLGAGVLGATQSLRRRLLAETIALGVAVTSTALCAVDLVLAVRHGDAVAWFGGWQPRHGVAIGVSFTIDPLGAGLAVFVGLLTIAALVFSWRHFETVGHVFPALLLVFMAAMIGFSLSGDIFNLFVFFELMSIAGIGLTCHRPDEGAPLQGALNFAITNAIGGFLVLIGIALLYGRTGALNLAQIGVALDGHRADGLVLVSFGLIVSGFFVKAAVVPFHFWLADAYATAPTPVCILFAGVMSELGLYAVARIYWVVYAGALGTHQEALRTILLTAGAVTALLGAAMCFLQHHLKRMLAFATISYIGLFLIGIALLSAGGLAGTAIYVVADGMVKASLFICVGIIQHRRSRVDEHGLRGLGRSLPYTGIVFFIGALALAALPPFGTFLGKSAIEGAALREGYTWVPALFTLAEIVTAAAVVRAAGRVFLGWGPRAGTEHGAEDQADEETSQEIEGQRNRTPPLLWLPAIVLLLAGLAVGVIPGVEHLAQAAATRFVDRQGYIAAVLHAQPPAPPLVATTPGPSVGDYLYAAVSSIGALLLACCALYLPGRARHPPAAIIRRASAAADVIRRLHSGHPGDYVAWVTAGTAVIAGACALTLR